MAQHLDISLDRRYSALDPNILFVATCPFTSLLNVQAVS